MIARLWRGWATAANAPSYQHHAMQRVFPSLTSIPGFRDAFLLAREESDTVEFLALTIWDGMDAIKRFAGENPDAAVVEPQARAILSDFDAVARHYAVIGNAPRNTPAK